MPKPPPSRVSTSGVLGHRDRLQVGRVAAGPATAQVVEHGSLGGDHADDIFVHHAMGQHRPAAFASSTDTAVALAALGAGENPAGCPHLGVAALLDLLEESVNQVPSGHCHRAKRYRMTGAKR